VIKSLFIVAAALLVGGCAGKPIFTPASTFNACGSVQYVNKTLGETYGEYKIFAGSAAQDIEAALWFSPTTASWTLVFTSLGGASCFVNQGGKGRLFPPEMGEKGDPV
tara:strand:+ start:2760 stop:3083 length:324 start_codon:yes stop_codon:yes gene_type:complete